MPEGPLIQDLPKYPKKPETQKRDEFEPMVIEFGLYIASILNNEAGILSYSDEEIAQGLATVGFELISRKNRQSTYSFSNQNAGIKVRPLPTDGLTPEEMPMYDLSMEVTEREITKAEVELGDYQNVDFYIQLNEYDPKIINHDPERPHFGPTRNIFLSVEGEKVVFGQSEIYYPHHSMVGHKEHRVFQYAPSKLGGDLRYSEGNSRVFISHMNHFAKELDGVFRVLNDPQAYIPEKNSSETRI